MAISFEVLATSSDSKARLGRLTTPHGVVETPVFMAVGTRGTVKGLTPAQLEEIGVSIILGNTYHLTLRPGDERVARLGGLHQFVGWKRPILTDSGGYQVFSLEDLRVIGDDGVAFRSHIDGQLIELTPESAVRIQENLGADIIMCLDECPPATADRGALERAVDRTTRWAERCQKAHKRADQALFGIVQGGTDESLRERSATSLSAMDFPGYAIGGVSVGEAPDAMRRVVEFTAPLLPAHKPRYLMGVGRPIDLIDAAHRGVDMFDCVLPTRNGRNAQAFTAAGVLKLRNAAYVDDDGPLDPSCGCYTCRHFSRAYLRHLFAVEEMLGPTLVSLHNLAFYVGLMAQARQAIAQDRFSAWRDDVAPRLS